MEKWEKVPTEGNSRRAHTVPGLTSESDSTRCGRAGGGKWARLAGEEARRVGWGQVRTVPLSYVLRLPPVAVAELVRVFKKSIDIRNSKAWRQSLKGCLFCNAWKVGISGDSFRILWEVFQLWLLGSEPPRPREQGRQYLLGLFPAGSRAKCREVFSANNCCYWSK